MRATSLLLLLACSTPPQPQAAPPCPPNKVHMCGVDICVLDTRNDGWCQGFLNCAENGFDGGDCNGDTAWVDSDAPTDSADTDYGQSDLDSGDTPSDTGTSGDDPADSALASETGMSGDDSSETGTSDERADTDSAAASETGTADDTQIDPRDTASSLRPTPIPLIESCVPGVEMRETYLGDGSCNLDLNCPALAYDGGDCLVGDTLQRSVIIRSADDALQLSQDVDRVQGTVELIGDGPAWDAILDVQADHVFVHDNTWLRNLHIEGDVDVVTVRNASLETLTLSTTRMTGRLTLEDCPLLSTVDTATLHYVESIEVLNAPQLALWNAPVLAVSNGIWLRGTALPSWPFAALWRAEWGIALEDNPQMTEADVMLTSGLQGAVVVRDNPALTRFAMPHVPRAESVLLRNLPALTDLSLDALDLVGGSVQVEGTDLSSIDLPALRIVGVGVWITDAPATSVDLPLLRQTGRLELSRLDVDTLTLPALTYGGAVRMQDNPAVIDIDLPVLELAETLHIEGSDGLRTVFLPELIDVSSGPQGDGRVFVGWNPSLADLHMPLLAHASRMELRWNGITDVSLPALDTLDERLLIDNSPIADLDLPALTWLPDLELRGLALPLVELAVLSTVDTCTLDDLPATEVRLPALHSVERFVLSDSDTQRLSLPALLDTDGWLNLVDLPDLQHLSMSPTRLGRLGIVRTGLTALDLPGLTTLDDHLALYANPDLATVALPDLRVALEVSLEDHPSLTTVDLDQLAVTGSLRLVELDALAQTDLPELRSIERRLLVRDNDLLADLSLPLLGTLQRLELDANPMLPSCDLHTQAVALGATIVSDVACP